MRCGGCLRAAGVVAVLLGLLSGALAQAEDDDEESADEPAPAGIDLNSTMPEQARYLLFSSTDIWRHGGFTHGGLLWAPWRLARDGPVLKLMFGGGVYHYLSGALGNADVLGVETAGSIQPGWRIVRESFTATVFLGADFQRHRLTPDDLSAGLRGNYAGVRTGFELWVQPTDMTMIAADASLSSIGPSYNARLAAGWRMFDRFYVGPEIQGFAADDNYKQIRAGLHITGFRTLNFEWSGGLGWAEDSDHRGSLYAKLGVYTQR
jgi:hypothetical protein